MERVILLATGAGALLWVTDMLLPDSRTARAACAVAGMLALHAVLTPLLTQLPGAGATPDMAIGDVLAAQGEVNAGGQAAADGQEGLAAGGGAADSGAGATGGG